MTDSLLPAPASICSQEVDCKWVRRNIGGSVIRLDIARDMVSVDLNIKSARGHTSIHMTPWDSQSQYKRWSNTYKPRDRTAKQIDAFRAAERRARAILTSRRISLHRTAGRHRALGDSLHRALDLMNSQMIPVTTTPWYTPCPHKTRGEPRRKKTREWHVGPHPHGPVRIPPALHFPHHPPAKKRTWRNSI